MHRRSFLTWAAFGWLAGMRRAIAQDAAQSTGQNAAQAAPPGPAIDPDKVPIPYGETRMGFTDEERQGFVYIPKAYQHGSPRPLLVMLHGFGGSADGMRYLQPLAEELGIALIAPESRDITWGQSAPGFDADSRYVARAFRLVTEYLDVDPDRVGLGGISDGATYAMSMGLAYGEVFTHLLIFSEGIPIPFRKQGKPKIFIGHGIKDLQMPIERTSRRFVPQLRREGYDITYREYDGGHRPPMPIVREGFEWFAGAAKKA